ncbi:DNA adenine methylase [Patescibacteria group bacterium]|nr:DNA adenine methylase [Patescibacteria group bacterium]
MVNTQIPKFVKWAGGKGQLIEQFNPYFPKEINRYFEPFVGSGAIFFHIIQNYNPKEILLSDINKELINTYKIIKNDTSKLIVKLKELKNQHTKLGKSFYLKIREQNPQELNKIERAARFIYLNKTCFNGLYRVNSKGKFNVPMGGYKNPDIVQEEKLKLVSSLLKKVKLKIMPFENIVNLVKKGDFIYFDPPYYPLKKGNSFTTYTKDKFMEKEQEKLAEVYKDLHKKGCKIMLSNSDTEFTKKLYSNFNIKTVKARRVINSDANGRGLINEILVLNYL